MLRKAWIVGISAAMAACVLGATAGFSEDTPPPRLRGTLDQVNGNILTIKTRSGTPTTVQLKDRFASHRDREGVDVRHPGQLVCRHYRNGAAGRHDQGRRRRLSARTMRPAAVDIAFEPSFGCVVVIYV